MVTLKNLILNYQSIYQSTAANIDEEALKSFSRDDLKDLFPGPENFLKRKKLWDFISQKVNTQYTTNAMITVQIV